MTRYAAIAAAWLVCLASPALADRIDGSWCHADQHLVIQGAMITTPGGTRLMGNYSRHAFVYWVPAGEPDGGTMMTLRLLDEDTVDVRLGIAPTGDLWKRCTPVSALPVAPGPA